VKRCFTDCDGSGPHSGTDEVKVLPIGGGAHVHLCRTCFSAELRWRRGRNLDPRARFEMPAWEDLAPLE
jgi:hypothetical protein